MASNGPITSQLACKCLNIRIHQQPTDSPPPPVEAGFTAVYVGEEGIRVAHTEVTLRSRSKPIPISLSGDPHPAELARYTTVICIICGLPTYRVAQRVTPDLSNEEGPVLPTDDWVEKELCKSSTGWIEVHRGCLTGEEIIQAETSPMYSKLLLLVLPRGTPPMAASHLSEDEPSAAPNLRGPSEDCKTHLPELPSLFLPPPFSTSHVVYAHFAAVASERSQKLRDEAEEYIAQATELKVAEVLQAEAALKHEVSLIWNRFRNSIRAFEVGAAVGRSNGPVRRRSVSGHARSTSNPSTRAAAQPISASVRITTFVPSAAAGHSTRISPSRPTESALSASLKTSGFHYYDAQRQTNGNGNASPSVHSLDLPSADQRRTSPARHSTTHVQSPSTSSTHTSAIDIDGETSIREAHRRQFDDSKDIATSYRYLMDLEAEMKQQRLQAEAEEAAMSSPPPVSSTSQAGAEGTTGVAARGHSPRVQRSAIKQRSKSPKEGAHTDDQKDIGKGKRKVTFDVQPEVSIINEAGPEVPTLPDNSGDAIIFDMDNESEQSIPVPVEVTEQSKDTTPPNSEHAPRPSVNRASSGGLPPQLSSLRPASLPAPSAMRPPRHLTSPTNEAAERSRALRESLGAPDAPRGRVDITDIPIRNSPVDAREEELMRLVAASTPSHRSAWKKNSKAWQVFLSRRERKAGELGPESIAEEGDYIVDVFNPRSKHHMNGVVDSDETDEDDGTDAERGIAQSVPIPIGPLRSFGIPSYQPKTSLSDRPGMLVPPLTSAPPHGNYAERERTRSADPGALDFTGDGNSPYDDDVESDPETGGKARQRALKILKASNQIPAAGMWRSLV